MRPRKENWDTRIKSEEQQQNTLEKMLVHLNMLGMNDEKQLIETDMGWQGVVE